jgi:hypothetical protein
MSTFGDRTFRQEVLDYILDEAKIHNLDHFQAVEALMDVVSHLAINAFRRDKALAQMYQDAKEAAKNELIAKMKL